MISLTLKSLMNFLARLEHLCKILKYWWIFYVQIWNPRVNNRTEGGNIDADLKHCTKMWYNFVWLCKRINDDGQLQATTFLIQVYLQKYYLLLLFCQHNRCRKLILSKSNRVYLKKRLHSRDRDIFIFIFAVTISKPSIFFEIQSLGWLSKQTHLHTQKVSRRAVW